MKPISPEDRVHAFTWSEEMQQVFLHAREVVESFEVREPFAAWCFRFSLRVEPYQDPDKGATAVLHVDFTSSHRDNGKPIHLNINRLLFLEMVARAADAEVYVQELVKSALRDAILHELMEAIHYRGQRAWDPHAGEGPKAVEILRGILSRAGYRKGGPL